MATTSQVSNFIKEVAPLVQRYARLNGYQVASPIIAQACLESQYGTSELAINAKNFFGLKYRPGRCPSACGTYIKVGSEQNPDGSYVSKPMEWCKFNSLEDSVKGYFEFISIPNYKNLKPISDPVQYLETIKADKYATSLNYVEKNNRVIIMYNLTKYDAYFNTKPGDKMDPSLEKQIPVTYNTLKEGDRIKLVKGATYYTGKKVPAWVYNKPYLYFRGFSPNGIIFSTKQTGDITGVVEEKYIRRVK